MKIVAISDTHGLHRHITIPECDLLIHAGDFSSMGREQEVLSFLNWFNVQPAKYKCFIAGNHDLSLQRDPALKTSALNMYPDLHYLEDSSVTIEGIKIYGSPFTPRFGSWAFMLPRGKSLQEKWAQIPEDTDILVTHGPPMQVLDRVSFSGEHVGDKDLLERIQVVKPRLMLVGHLHENPGKVLINGDQTIVANVAICDDKYDPVNSPMEFEISARNRIWKT